MGGHRKFSELTRRFTPEDRQHIEQIKAEMRDAIDSTESSIGSGSTGTADLESWDVHRPMAIDPDKP